MTRRTVLVTGGTRGIGRATVQALACDHRVVIGGTDADAVAALAMSLPDAQGFVCDLTDAQQRQRAVAALPAIDVVVHSAGTVAYGPVDVMSASEWQRVFDINVFAVAELTRVLLPGLRERRGQVIFINSGSGLTSKANTSVYAASKFALTALADVLREEERGKIRVTSIHPGRVDTDMQRELQAAQGRPYDAGDHLSAASVASLVRAAVIAANNATVESITIRPA